MLSTTSLLDFPSENSKDNEIHRKIMKSSKTFIKPKRKISFQIIQNNNNILKPINM